MNTSTQVFASFIGVQVSIEIGNSYLCQLSTCVEGTSIISFMKLWTPYATRKSHEPYCGLSDIINTYTEIHKIPITALLYSK